MKNKLIQLFLFIKIPFLAAAAGVIVGIVVSVFFSHYIQLLTVDRAITIRNMFFGAGGFISLLAVIVNVWLWLANEPFLDRAKVRKIFSE